MASVGMGAAWLACRRAATMRLTPHIVRRALHCMPGSSCLAGAHLCPAVLDEVRHVVVQGAADAGAHALVGHGVGVGLQGATPLGAHARLQRRLRQRVPRGGGGV